MAGKVNITFADYDNERSTFSSTTPTFSGAAYDANITLVTNLYNALNAVSLGNPIRQAVLAVDTDISSAPAGSAFAQRESKWLVSMSGATSGKLYQREIPAADLALLAPNSDEMVAGTERTNLVDALEAIFRGDGDELVTVTSIRHVGRNS